MTTKILYPALSTKLKSFTRSDTTPVPADIAQSQQKKQARIKVSVANMSPTLGFLHACLIVIDNVCFALAGPSGVGKSTIAAHLQKQFNCEIIANDWIAVEKEGESYYASDLNHASDIKHKKRIKLDGVVIMSLHDKYLRDAYVPINNDLKKRISACFDTMPVKSTDTLTRFWMNNIKNLSFHYILPTRDRGIESSQRAIELLVSRSLEPVRDRVVGIIGTGSVGAQLASDIAKLPYVAHVHLYNSTYKKAVGLALDLNHGCTRNRPDIFVAHEHPEDIFKTCDEVFIAIGKKKAKKILTALPERWAKITTNKSIIDKYGRMAAKTHFNGTVFMITNPVDYLTYNFYQAAQSAGHKLTTFQVYGIGLEADFMRMVYYAHQDGHTLTRKDIDLIGNHSDELAYHTSLPTLAVKSIFDRMRGASSEVRQYVPRTIYGPVSAAIRTYEAYHSHKQCHVTTIRKEAFIGERVCFKPLGLNVSRSTFHGEAYRALIRDNRKSVRFFSRQSRQ